MTENEAIKVLEKPSKHIRMVHKTKNEMEFYTFSSDLVEAFEMAIKALEEIQQYRELGTVEEILKVLNNQRTIIATQHETLKQYRAIGTIEELKALKEKDEDLRLKYCYEDLSEADNLGYMRGYNKAIDEFADELINHSIYADIGKGNETKMEWASPVTRIKEVAEQLKGGVK